MILPRKFYLRPTLPVAKDLLGKYLVYKNKSAKIIEVEAYVGQKDLACHASKGKTKRNEAMFLDGGHIYIYLIYGIYHCLNIVTGKKDHPEAVLIRALEYEDCDGPGKLCRKFGLTRAQNGLDLTTPLKVNPEQSRGIDLTKGPIYIEDRGVIIPKNQIISTPRIGVAYAGKWAKKPWRFLVSDSKFLSRKQRCKTKSKFP